MTMRFLLQVSMPVEAFNDAVRDGTAGKKLGRILEEIKPEAAYFYARDGKRSALLVVDMADTSEIPHLAEPWFLNFNATIDIQPVMTPDDLQRAGLEQIAEKWV